jgi:FO synthase
MQKDRAKSPELSADAGEPLEPLPVRSIWFEEAAQCAAEYLRLSTPVLLRRAYRRARNAHGALVTYSPKVFIPLTRLCRDICSYCTFAQRPTRGQPAFMSAEEILTVARRGAHAGCSEALFTFGEMPELRYKEARSALAVLDHSSTNAYCHTVSQQVLRETGLLPHINAGILSARELARFKEVSASQGLMLENVSERLCRRGQAHFGSPGKAPGLRLATIAAAGELSVAFTTGILVGIGETEIERIASLIAIRDLQVRYGHIQEVIVQNFLPKPATRMADHPALSFEEMLRTVAIARLILPAEVNLQAPPNLSFARFAELLSAGINDWGGISSVTPDHVNPEAAWPEIGKLRTATKRFGLHLAARLPIYPRQLHEHARWLAPEVAAISMQSADGAGLARQDRWSPGESAVSPPPATAAHPGRTKSIDAILGRATRGDRLLRDEITTLLGARDAAFDTLIAAADEMRRNISGAAITYVVNRNINYTNICTYRCGFCAFSKGRSHDDLRGAAYDLPLEEIARRTQEAWGRGAVEVCMQGGIHPRFTGNTYMDILRAAKQAVPQIHVHAFSPLEVQHGATSLQVPVATFLAMLRDAGLGSLPGTAAEILVDSVRAALCPDKLGTEQWLEIVATAHRIGLRTTATIMFGHLETYQDDSEHLLAIRDLQEKTGGFTEFVPLPFVHRESPLYRRGKARRGPPFRETLVMHAVARLVFGRLIPNIQASWVKLGREALQRCACAGVNDFGGTLMNESISRAAGASHGQELSPAEMDALAAGIGRAARQRNTLYGEPAAAQVAKSHNCGSLEPIHLPVRPAKRVGNAQAEPVQA